MSERRKVERKRLVSFTPVYDLHKDELLGYLGDLTQQGAMLLGNKMIENDHRLILAIEFPKTPVTSAARILIPSRVAWCRKEENTAYFNTGFEFLVMTENSQDLIETVLDWFQFKPVPPDWQPANLPPDE